MSELEPLPPDLHDLFAAERSAYKDDAAARDRVMRRIEAAAAFAAVGSAIAAGAGAGGASSVASWLVAKKTQLWIALALAAGVATGEVHGRYAAARSSATASSSPSPSAQDIGPTLRGAASSEPAPPAVAVDSLPRAQQPAPPQTAGAVPTASALRTSDLAGEQALIDAARAALARARPADALAATSRHAEQFPRGRLAEEREVLAIQALVVLGRRPQAEARLAQFHRAFPSSLYGEAVNSLLAKRTADGGQDEREREREELR